MTVEEVIQAVLFGAVRDIETFTDETKAWPNVTFVPPSGEAYLRVAWMPNNGQRYFFKGTNPQLYLGILQLTVVSPLNEGSGVATQLAGEVAAAFPADRRIYDAITGLYVRIERAPDVAQAFPVDATWNVQVTVRYECFASPSALPAEVDPDAPIMDFSEAGNSMYITLA